MVLQTQGCSLSLVNQSILIHLFSQGLATILCLIAACVNCRKIPGGLSILFELDSDGCTVLEV